MVFELDLRLQTRVPGYTGSPGSRGVGCGGSRAIDDLVGRERPAVDESTLDDFGPAPEFRDVTTWLNSGPLTLSELRGKVVLLDFWTYSCINCLRTLPYLRRLGRRVSRRRARHRRRPHPGVRVRARSRQRRGRGRAARGRATRSRSTTTTGRGTPGRTGTGPPRTSSIAAGMSASPTSARALRGEGGRDPDAARGARAPPCSARSRQTPSGRRDSGDRTSATSALGFFVGPGRSRPRGGVQPARDHAAERGRVRRAVDRSRASASSPAGRAAPPPLSGANVFLVLGTSEGRRRSRSASTASRSARSV